MNFRFTSKLNKLIWQNLKNSLHEFRVCLLLLVEFSAEINALVNIFYDALKAHYFYTFSSVAVQSVLDIKVN